MNLRTLLPPNATKLEQRTAYTLKASTDLPVQIKSLGSILTAPAPFLPFLAWQYSVDRWEMVWGANIQRQVIKNSFAAHQIKGTPASLQKIVAPLGYTLTFSEWWQQTPEGTPGTFSLTLNTNNQHLLEHEVTTFLQLIDDTKPVSRHLLSINLITATANAKAWSAATCYDGEIITIWPQVPTATTTAITPTITHDHLVTTITPQA